MHAVSRVLSACHPSAVAICVAMTISSAGYAHARTVAYVSNADSYDIYVLELHLDDGTASVIEKVPVDGNPMPMAVSPDRKTLYAAARSAQTKTCSVFRFAIAPDDGTLMPLGSSPLADDMTYISIDHTGKYLFGASYSGNKLSLNAIGKNGEVAPEPSQVITTGKNAHCVVVDPSNKFLFVPCLGDNLIQQYRFDQAGGEIIPNMPPSVAAKKGAGPRHLVFRRDGRFAWCANELDGTVDTFAVEAAGTLTSIGTDSVMPDEFKSARCWTADLHLTPDDRFLYVSERTSNTLATFRVDGESGKLTRIGNYPTEKQPRGFNIDPSGKYLLAVGQKSNGLSLYKIDPQSGALGAPSHLDLGQNPNWVEIITLPETRVDSSAGAGF